MKPLSRREALKAAAAAAATGCAGRDVGGGKDQDDTGTLPPGQIDHVIVVMMENRSFDHWLGGRALFEGMSAEDGPTEAMFNLNTLGDPVAPHTSTAPCVADPPHGWDSSHRQFNDGANDGFCTEYAAQAGGTGDGVMAVMERSTIPLTYALADRFCVMDRHFCSVLGPTWPNRLYAHMASSQGVRGNYLPGPAEPFSDRTIWHALNEMGIDWHYYYGDVPFIGLFEGLWDDEKVDFVEQFYRDCADGNLPPVCWIDPAFSYNDNHPPHHPGLGELFIASIHEALANSTLWERCLVLLTYDEHGGFFDHVPPPTLDDERADEGFDQLGFRIPAQAFGPWVKQGVVSTTFDHTSWIRMVCEMHGIELWNQRLKATNSLADVIDQARMASGIPLPPDPLPSFDFDEDSVGDECFYGPPDPHLVRLASHLRAQGIKLKWGG